MAYCVDTSGWLDGWQRYYPPDVFPSLWRKIEDQVAAGQIFSSEEVYVELSKKADDLHDWIKARKEMLVSSEEAVQLQVTYLLKKYPRLVDTLKNRSQADPFVVAVAMEHKLSLVTGEVGGTIERPRIPFVCAAEGVICINFLQMIRELGLTF
jgi:hypothetical protein